MNLSDDKMPLSEFQPELNMELGELSTRERFWRNQQAWLEKCGYMLRPRYRPGWVPSPTDKEWSDTFDGRMTGPTLDAVRIRDNTEVALKILHMSSRSVELEIGLFFSSPPIAKDPRNHCVPILEVLQVPDDEDCTIIVMPLLRKYREPRFATIGEAVDFFSQIFEGVKFMHDHNIAHRDCNSHNIMFGPSAFVPGVAQSTRPKPGLDRLGKSKLYIPTQSRPKYYLIDFGVARKYSTRDPPPLEPPPILSATPAPECQASKPCDPFPTDVYNLGNMIREQFLEGINWYTPRLRGFEFMRSLVDDMVASDPARRPTMEEVVTRFVNYTSSMSSRKLKSRVVKGSDLPAPLIRLKHWTRRVGDILLHTPFFVTFPALSYTVR